MRIFLLSRMIGTVPIVALISACVTDDATRKETTEAWTCTAAIELDGVKVSSERKLNFEGRQLNSWHQWQWNARQREPEVSMQQWFINEDDLTPEPTFLFSMFLPKQLLKSVRTVEVRFGGIDRPATDLLLIAHRRYKNLFMVRAPHTSVQMLIASKQPAYLVGLTRDGQIANWVELDLEAMARGRAALGTAVRQSQEMAGAFADRCEAMGDEIIIT